MGKLCRVEEAHVQLQERLQRSFKEKSELQSRLDGTVEPNKENADTMEKLCRVIEVLAAYMKSDPVKIATEGVERFKKENCDFIIVDACGCLQQEASLFEEMRQLAESMVNLCSLLLSSYMLQEQAAHAAEGYCPFFNIMSKFLYLVCRYQRLWGSKDFAQKHYHDLKERPFFNGPVLAMVRVRQKQVSSLRKLYKMGNQDFMFL
ncbi:hypothetical protein MKW92_018166 [Papaver armeniacum]|nr:hypothetical protein MKW92_018166 [Papaver armeniacum]